jgi:hypothetical protein
MAGLFAGLAYATRGPALAYPGAVAFALGITFFASVRRKDPQDGPGVSRKLRNMALLLAVFLLAFVVSAKGVSWPLQLRAKSLGYEPPISYLKMVIIDGGFYAKSGKQRDNWAYALNESCTGFASAETLDLRWSTLLRGFGVQQLRAWKTNLRKTVLVIFPDLHYPFSLTFFSLAVGAVVLWYTRPVSEMVLLASIAAVYLLLIPAIQLQERYLLPLCALTYPLMGLGLASMLNCRLSQSRVKNSLARGFGGLLVAGFCLLSTAPLKDLAAKEDVDKHYREASRWLVQNVPADGGRTMTRRHCVYAYTQAATASMPVDPLPRLLRYCRHIGCRYLVLGPDERRHNPHLAEIRLPAEIDGWILERVASFGRGDQNVQVLRIRDAGA